MKNEKNFPTTTPSQFDDHQLNQTVAVATTASAAVFIILCVCARLPLCVHIHHQCQNNHNRC